MTETQLYNAAMNATDKSVAKARTTSASNFVEGRICRRCNNGWMHELENQAKPLLVPLIEGDVSLFSVSHQQRIVLARWAAKTAYVLSYTSALGKNANPTHLRLLMQNPDSLPPGVGAFAQQISTGRDFAAIQRNAWPRLIMHDEPPRTQPMRPPELSYKIAVELRHIMLLVAFWPAAPSHFLLEAGVHVPLWPVLEWYPAYFTQMETRTPLEPDSWLDRFSSSLAIISEGQQAHSAGASSN